MRMIYERMEYLVRQGKDYSGLLKSLIGLLTGDTASPGLWTFYLADCVMPDDADDVLLNGRPISFVAQADDIAMWSTSPAGLQRKIDVFLLWCCVNFMVISAMKTMWMILGPPPRILPVIRVGPDIIKLVTKYKYVGVMFRSTHRYIFADQYTAKAAKGRSMSYAIFAMESFIGGLPAFEGKTLYMARLDPHLTAGCEVVLDVETELLGLLEDVQHKFIRRLLGLTYRSMLCVLFTETGILPIRYRRIVLALGYLKYLVLLPESRLAWSAYMDSMRLARLGHKGWVNDLRFVLLHLPKPVIATIGQLSSAETIDDLIDEVVKSCETSLQLTIDTSPKTVLLRNRVEKGDDGSLKAVPLHFRDYLRAPAVHHVKAVTRWLTGDSPLAVDVLRNAVRGREPVPRVWRLCRFCHAEVEDAAHIFLTCGVNEELVLLRKEFLESAYAGDDALRVLSLRIAAQDMIHTLVARRSLRNQLGKFVWNIGELLSVQDVFIAER
ncbi:hypothetical protein PLICRDRAFT_148104 [Plicaturopsis crispa FD-325 SS-3]|uniref:Reverse transcriptase domain-containing protein n=1 Tax=Plicaturopsis crispa FD-325 SS-3 TaxID=944288 RepID=A0A0C9SKC9_PLICR|nr:hypothetical protein PLICRDRAFT_148104 [Plicaturopsis crispa FD-325 SS-3]